MRNAERVLWACVAVSLFVAASLVVHERAGTDHLAPIRTFDVVSTTTTTPTATTTVTTTPPPPTTNR